MDIKELRIGMVVHERLCTIQGETRYSIPMRIAGIFEDGTVYLDFDGNEAGWWEANIKDIELYEEKDDD